MNSATRTSSPERPEPVRVSVVVRDSRGFTHYYEEIRTTPNAVRDAFDLMSRAAEQLA